MSGITNETNDRQGIRLERFSTDNAELVLDWRNADHVRANSLNDEAISREDHMQFLRDLKASADRNFFVVYQQGSPIGVLNVNVTDRVGYWGCYLGGDEQNAVRPGLFSLLVGIAGVVAFDVLDCAELRSDVLQRNVPPQTMNAFLQIPVADSRYEERPSGERIVILSYILSREEWPLVLKRIETTLSKRQRELLQEFSRNAQI